MTDNSLSMQNIQDGLTLSGLDIRKIPGIKDSWFVGFDEFFVGEAWMFFNLKDAGLEEFKRVETLIQTMSQYDDLGDFLRIDADETQKMKLLLLSLFW